MNAFRLTGGLDGNGAETCELGQIVINSGNSCAFEMPLTSENSSIWTTAPEKFFNTGEASNFTTASQACAAHGGYLPMIRTHAELDGIIGNVLNTQIYIQNVEHAPQLLST